MLGTSVQREFGGNVASERPEGFRMLGSGESSGWEAGLSGGLPRPHLSSASPTVPSAAWIPQKGCPGPQDYF